MNIISRQYGIRMLLLAVVLVLFGQGLMAQSGGIVIEGGTLIDGTGAPPLQEAVIVIQGNKIIAVGRKGTVSYPQGAPVIQAAGKFILPGLIDAHVHFQPWTAELYLAHGVTSVVDLGSTQDTLHARDLIASGKMRGPRLFLSIRAHNGRTNWMSDPNSWGGIASPAEARQFLIKTAPGRDKYVLTKIYTETPPDILRAVAEESHKAGRNVTGHLGLLDIREAVEAGLDGVAHFTGIALATMSDPAKAEQFRYFMRMGIAVDYPLYLAYHAFMDPAKVDQLIPFLVQKNVRIQPEFVNIARWAMPHMRELYRGEDRRLFENPNLQYVPFYARARYFYTYDRILQLFGKEHTEQLAKGYENVKSFVHRFVQAGGTILAGTDTTTRIVPGMSLQRELELLVEAGLTPMQAIQAATKNNAQYIRVNELGTIEPGKLADLIIVKGDPLASIHNTRTIDTVLQDGKVVDTSYHADFSWPEEAGPPPGTDTGGHPNPRPILKAVIPMMAKGLNKEIKITIDGENLIEESAVEFDGIKVPTTPVKSTLLPFMMFYPVYTQLEATIPPQLLSKQGTHKVTVRNPDPGETSNVVGFYIE